MGGDFCGHQINITKKITAGNDEKEVVLTPKTVMELELTILRKKERNVNPNFNPIIARTNQLNPTLFAVKKKIRFFFKVLWWPLMSFKKKVVMQTQIEHQLH